MAAPAVQITRVDAGDHCLLRLSGVINETFDTAAIGSLPGWVAIDLAGVSRITSPGVRLWCDFVRPADGRRFLLLNCPPIIVDQLNLVLTFAGASEVLTVRLGCVCDACDFEREVVVDLLSSGAVLPPRPACDRCGELMAWDDPNALRFAARAGIKSLPEKVARFLASVAGYRASVLENRPLKVRKLVEPEGVLLDLDGLIDARFPSERAAEGVDGNVLVSLASALFTPSGLVPFRLFLNELQRHCPLVALVSAPVELVEMIERDQLPLGKVQVYSARLPLYCAACDLFADRDVKIADVAEGITVQAPCERCARTAQLVMGMVALDRVLRSARELPKQQQALMDRRASVISAAVVEERLHTNSEQAPPPSGRTHVGGYRLVRPLSAGGMAEVFIAAKESLGGVEKKVALKVFRRSMFALSRTTAHMFLKEARLCARLNHPNIIEVYDVGEAEGDLYMAMEYIEGRDLLAILHQARRVPTSVVLHVGALIADALDHAHAARDFNGELLKIVHRDVSLQNVLVGLDGRVKLIDFGIAIVGEELNIRPEMLAGNSRYMSPEQVQREPLDGRSDIFSLGVVLYEMLAGKRLFGRERLEETLMAVLNMTPPLIADVSPELNAVLRKALAKDRKDRYQTAGELAAAIRALAEHHGGRMTHQELGVWVEQLFRKRAAAPVNEVSMVTPDPVESIAIEQVQRKRRLYLGALVVALTMGAGLAWLFTR